jgi:hypothetical protein
MSVYWVQLIARINEFSPLISWTPVTQCRCNWYLSDSTTDDVDKRIFSVEILDSCDGLIYIDFQKNNFTLSAPLPKIPYLKWARVRLNRFWRLYTLSRKDLAHLVNLFFGNVYKYRFVVQSHFRCVHSKQSAVLWYLSDSTTNCADKRIN